VGGDSCEGADAAAASDGQEMFTASVTLPASLFATQIYKPVTGDADMAAAAASAVDGRSVSIRTASVRRAGSSTAAPAVPPDADVGTCTLVVVDCGYFVVRPFGSIQNNVGAGSPVAEHFNRPVSSPSIMSMLLNTGACHTQPIQFTSPLHGLYTV